MATRGQGRTAGYAIAVSCACQFEYLTRRSWRMAIATALLTDVSVARLGAALARFKLRTARMCASARSSIAVEVDALRQVPAIPFDVPAQGQPVSLRAILSGGGIDTAVTPDDLDLPYKAASGPLDRADSVQIRRTPGVARQFRQVQMQKFMHCSRQRWFRIVASRCSESCLTSRIDKGFAVAPPTTANQFGDREPDAVPLLQLRTFTHELLHALNRRHFDAVEMSDGRLTLEAPTRCISAQERGQWFLREPPLMEVSPATIRFFQTAASRDILPGEKSSPFSSRRASPTECDELRARICGGSSANSLGARN